MDTDNHSAPPFAEGVLPSIVRAGDGDAGHGGAISVGSGDDAVTRIQLAARWAEAFAPTGADSLQAMLQRFRTAFEYLDAVTHGIEPPAQEAERSDAPA